MKNNRKVLVILCHPYTDSYNGAVSEHVIHALEGLGYIPVFHDLYREEFDPVTRPAELRSRFSFDEQVLAFWSELEESEGLILVYPDWWGGPPALLKGWIDRVFRPGVAFEYAGEEFEQKSREPLLAGKRGLVFCTTDSEDYEGSRGMETVWMRRIFSYCGMSPASFHIFHGIRESALKQRKEWLEEVERRVEVMFGQETE